MKLEFTTISYFNTQHLVDLVNERNSFLDKYHNSVDENFNYTIDEPKEIEEIKNEIIEYIKEHKDTLAVDVILEALTNLGDEPSVLYNGEGLFCIASLSETYVDESFLDEMSEDAYDRYLDETDHNIPVERWYETVREALDYYIKNY